MVKSLMRRKNPQDKTGTGADDAGQQAKAEADGRRKITVASWKQFMERANRQAAIGQGAIKRRRAQRNGWPSFWLNFRANPWANPWGKSPLLSDAPAKGLKVIFAGHPQ